MSVGAHPQQRRSSSATCDERRQSGSKHELTWAADREDVVPTLAKQLAVLSGLTPAEARLAAALTARQSVEGYAEQAGITIGTARWNLKRVLEKTGCRR
jgi:DNA-binding CsgD family transcriptional regulator